MKHDLFGVESHLANALLKSSDDSIHSYEPCFKIDLEHLEKSFIKFKKNILSLHQLIEDGYVYQANIAINILIKTSESLLLNLENLYSLYKQVSDFNPAPYGVFYCDQQNAILSSSPESFLKLEHCSDRRIKISSSPIKGTAKTLAKLKVEKELSEHTMIVDLIRNDLAQIAQIGSLKVNDFLNDFKFKELLHIISTVEVDLAKEFKLTGENIADLSLIFDILLPGGSISGAPKKAACQYIEELEEFKRGLYTGVCGYYILHQGGEFNILIRTLLYDLEKNELSYATGAGITINSKPEAELAEIKLKAKKVLEALGVDHFAD